MAGKEKYMIKVEGKLVEVTSEVYYAYFRMERQERGQEEKKTYNQVMSYDALDDEEKRVIDNIPDEAITSMDEIVIANDMKNRLHRALEMLPKGERELLQAIYFQGKTEAQYVRYAVSSYLSGKSASAIAKEFTDKSIEDPVLGRRKWSFQAVVEMLKNEKYAGDALCQKTFMTDTLPRQCLRNRGERDRYYAANAHPAIIDRQSFEAVQKLLQLRSENHVQHTTKTSPLGGRFICGKCGAGFRRKQTSGRFVFACTTHAQDRNACDMLQIPEEEIYRAFLRLYCNLKDHPEVLDFLVKNLIDVRDRQMLWSPAVVELNKQISDILNQSHALALLNKQGLVDPDIFISKSNQLAEQLRKAKQQKETLQKREDNDIIEKTKCLREVFLDGPEYLDVFDEELFCELVDKIIVESNTRIRFRLTNGLELAESIERTVR